MAAEQNAKMAKEAAAYFNAKKYPQALGISAPLRMIKQARATEHAWAPGGGVGGGGRLVLQPGRNTEINP